MPTSLANFRALDQIECEVSDLVFSDFGGRLRLHTRAWQST